MPTTLPSYSTRLTEIRAQKEAADIQVQTLGGFQVWRLGTPVSPKAWGRDITIQLFQFFITSRHRNSLHKEQIIDRLWENVDTKTGDQYFKVALHGINKVLEPDRKSRSESKYILRQGATYQLNWPAFWIDAQSLDDFIELGNAALHDDPPTAAEAYRHAIELYHGIYLPDRLYEDWSSAERERIQVLILGAIITLSELLLDENPMESIRLTQKALQIDPAWEDAYRIQMAAYLKKGNRPQAIKTYQKCREILDEEFGVEPLPETRRLFEKIRVG
ncbi:MAG: transcriptional regulator [Bacteroidetes bacterium]|nr:MAG: transcriptional regulator [Bacteroidota bacterium]